MLKLYNLTNTRKEYWETWENNDGTHTVHLGKLGEKGESKIIKSSIFKKAETLIQKEIDELISKGFQPLEDDEQNRLIIEYSIDGTRTKEDLEKRHRLENRMNETLGWTGLGHCDGGSIGSGTMEVCNYVVDFELAKEIIENELNETEFSDYNRIYLEE